MVAVLDYLTSADLILRFLYIAPVGFLAWFGPNWAGIGAALVAAGMSLEVEIARHAPFSNVWTPYGNAVLRLLSLLLVVLALRELKRRYQVQRRLALMELEHARQLQAAAHDLKGPITAILGMAETLEHNGTVPEDLRRELIDRVIARARGLDRMIDDLLDTQVLDPARAPLERERINVQEFAMSIVDGLASLDEHPTEVEAEGVIALVSPAKLERIFENLLINAYKHTPPGTRVWVRAKRTNGEALLVVEDDGPGVPVGMRKAVFEAFARGGGDVAGTGLGLFLVAGLAEMHGGEAWVEERAGGGASFHVLLPDGAAANGVSQAS